ncbi:MAG: GAF domain-containing sensor histidine kinase [Anaerolineales bacterium]|nr:GAF domain-containing sensor histidine kinase [Anaerolineales bacterium]
MNAAGDHPIEPGRPISDGYAFFLDAGYGLVVIGCTLLLTAAVPNAHPLIPAGSLLGFALILLPVRQWLRRQLSTSPERKSPRSQKSETACEGNSETPPGISFAEELPARETGPSGDPQDLLLRLTLTFHSTSDLDVLLELISSQILRRIPAVSFRIALAEENSGVLYYVFYSENGSRRVDREGLPFPAAEDLAGVVVRSGRPLVVEDYSEACRMHELPEREPTTAWAGLPLSAGASTIGAILLARGAPFTPPEQSLLISVAEIAGPAIAKARLEKEAARQAALLANLLRASRRILGAATRDHLSDSILAGARELLPCQAALLLLPTPSGLWTLARQSGATDVSDGFPPLGVDHPFARSAAGDQLTFAETLPEDDPFRALTRPGGAPFLCAVSLPLRVKERITGWIVFWNPLRAAPPQEIERILLHEYAALAVAALDRIRSHEPADAESAALAEELTSLQNLDQELNSVSDPAEAMAITLDWAVRYAEAAAGLAALLIGEELEMEAAVGYPEGAGPEEKCRLPAGSAGFHESIRSGEPVIRRADGAAVPGLLAAGRTALYLPIRRNTRTLGVLLLESYSDNAFPPAVTAFLQRMASHAAIAISNTRLYTEVRNANQAKSEFISFVAHELKTPMTSIRGYTDLVAQGAVGPVSQSQANFLATIRLNVDRMAALVSDLNDVSRIESGRLKLEFAAVALAPALEEVIEALRSLIEGKEQKLALEIPSDLPPVWVDRGRLIQILTNLISNAHKYTPHGGSLRIAAEHSPNRWDPAGPPEVVHCCIQDSGLGIALQEQKSIFQKFFRSEDGTVRDLPGTGLGLHITRNLVEMHGGKIWFESELHKGSTFHFTVPAASV